MEHIHDYIEGLKATLDRLPFETIDELTSILEEARANRRQIFVMGNGGSASTASHFVADLAKNTRAGHLPDFRVMGLTDNMAIFSAYANDDGYENVFAQQLANFVRPYDVVIGISTSGNSANVLKAMEVADRVKAVTIALTGFDGGKLGPMVDLHIHVPSKCIELVEDIHLMIEHIVVKTLKEKAQEPGILISPDLAHSPVHGFNGSDKSGSAEERDREEESMRASLELLYTLSRQFDSRKDINELLQRVLELSVESVGASSGSVLMLDESGEVFQAALAYAGRVNASNSDSLLDVAQNGLAGWVVENRQATIVSSTRDDPRWLKRRWDRKNGSPRSAISVPLMGEGRVVGVITLGHKQAGQFNKDDLILLMAVAVVVSSKVVGPYREKTAKASQGDEP